MPSVMAIIGGDATGFNRAAEQVITKTQQVAQKVQSIGGKQINFSRGTGLASDPAVFVAEQSGKKVADTNAKLRAAEKAAALREVDDLRRMGKAGAEAKALGAKEGRNSARFMREAVAEESAALGLGSRRASALGGGLKLFGGMVAAGFIKRQSAELIDYASHVVATGARLRMSAEDVQAWDRALQQSGSSLKDAEPVLDRFNKSRVMALGGNARQSSAASVLGLSRDQLRTMTTGDLVKQAGLAVKGGANQEAVLAALQTMGGDGALKLVEAFQEGLGEKIDEVKESGSLLSNETAARLKDVGDRWSAMTQKITGGISELGGKLLSFFGNLGVGLLETMDVFAKMNVAFFKTLFTGGPSKALEVTQEIWNQEKKKDDERRDKLKEAEKGEPSKDVKVDVADKRREREEAALDKQVQREMEREMAENAKLGKHSVNSLQQMGGFMGNFNLAVGPELAAMNAQVRSEEHLRIIREQLIKKKETKLSGEEVEF
jgi:hypothetical protein